MVLKRLNITDIPAIEVQQLELDWFNNQDLDVGQLTYQPFGKGPKGNVSKYKGILTHKNQSYFIKLYLDKEIMDNSETAMDIIKLSRLSSMPDYTFVEEVPGELLKAGHLFDLDHEAVDEISGAMISRYNEGGSSYRNYLKNTIFDGKSRNLIDKRALTYAFAEVLCTVYDRSEYNVLVTPDEQNVLMVDHDAALEFDAHGNHYDLNIHSVKNGDVTYAECLDDASRFTSNLSVSFLFPRHEAFRVAARLKAKLPKIREHVGDNITDIIAERVEAIMKENKPYYDEQRAKEKTELKKKYRPRSKIRDFFQPFV